MLILKSKLGMTILYKRIKSKFVDMRYGIKCGSIDELAPTDWGLCHALEHMFFRGTTNRDWSEINRGTKRIGGYSNAQTGYSNTLYQMNTTKDAFRAGFEILADCMYNSKFPEEWWEVEKGAIITEINMREDSPDLVLAEYAIENALGKRAHDISGSPSNIENATIADLLRFRNSYYSGPNLVLAIAGDLSKQEVLKVVNRFDKWPSRKPVPRKAVTGKFNYAPVSLHRKELAQAYVLKIKPIKLVSDEEDFAMGVAGDVLSTILFEELREKQGLCYGAGCSFFDDITDKEIVEIGTSVDRSNLKPILGLLDKTLTYFLKEGLTDARLEETRATVKRQLLTASETPSANTKMMLDVYFDGDTTDKLTVYTGFLKTIKDSYIRKIAKKHLVGNFKTCIMTEKSK